MRKLLLPLLLALSAHAAAQERLVFEHIGPEDAALPVFALAPEPQEGAFCIGQHAYGDVLAIAVAAPDASKLSPRPMGTFKVRREGRERRLSTLGPDSMRAISARLARYYETEQRPRPALLGIVDTLLRLPP